jgi:hypothetical protein
MRGIPSFNDFEENSDLFEPLDESLLIDIRSIELSDQSYKRINENIFLDQIKNNVSKFLLGPLSGISMIDEAADIILYLELEFIKKSHEFEKRYDEIEEKIDQASEEKDNDKIRALQTQRQSIVDESEKYSKTQKLKIEKAVEGARKIASSSKRRKDYLAAKIADNEIEISELEYKLAKERSENQESLKKYEAKLAKAKAHAQAQAQALNQAALASGSTGATGATGASSKTTTSKTSPIRVVWVIDGKVEKKKYATKKAKAVLKRKDEVEQDIADIKLAIAKKLDLLVDKVNKSATPVTSKYLSSVKSRLMDLTAGLDARVNLLKLFRSLGKTETEMQLKLDDPDTFSKFMDKVEISIHDGKDIRTGKSKVITDLFDRAASDPASVSISKIEDAKLKLNK